MTRIFGRAGLAGFTSVILTLSAPVGPATAISFSFPQVDDSAAMRALAVSTVRIFRSEKAASQDGSGFVIDSEEGLIVSAAHVVRDINGPVWVAFPDSGNRYRASVLKPDSSSAGEGAAPDFAVLKLDQPQEGASALEIQLEEINDEQMHRVTGFGRANKAPLPAAAMASKQGDCKYVIRVPTLHGDSGSAVLTPEGLVDGIAVEGAESGGTNSMAETLVLPLACVRDRILAVIPDGESAEILKIFGSGDDLALRNAFQPSANVRRRFSNLRLAKALSGWIAERNRNRQLLPLVDGQHMPQVMKIIVDRRLGYVLLNELMVGALRLHPMDAEALNNRCWALAMVGYFQTALKDCNEALQRWPSYADALDSRGFVKLLYGRGIAKKQTGDTAGGDKDIAEAKAIDPAIAAEFDRHGSGSLALNERDKIATFAEDKPSIDIDINFEYNSAKLAPSAMSMVRTLGEALSSVDLKGSTFLVEGHTDAKGSKTLNQKLSERRADAIKRFLVEQYRIPAANLVAVGYGKTKLKNKDNPFGAENRRIRVVNMANNMANK
jgi:outer membrane protein OmpA-like peptidoglycan-associated protein